MILGWFDASEGIKIAMELADQLVPPRAPADGTQSHQLPNSTPEKDFQRVLQRVDREVRRLNLNFYKTAKFANSFKWRLLDNGVASMVADDLTQRLILHLSTAAAEATPYRAQSFDVDHLLAQGDGFLARGEYADAAGFYRELIGSSPGHSVALNNLGAALSGLGRYQEAESYFRRAIEAKPDYSEAHGNLGTVLRWRGYFAEAEESLRQALKLNPKNRDARINLGISLTLVNRTREAKVYFAKSLKAAPRDANALFGMALVAKSEGRFDESIALINRALGARPDMPSAWAGLAGMRKMSTADAPWLRSAEEIAGGGKIPLIEEADLRFAIGKYHDDVGDFARAFASYRRANELLKTSTEGYDRDAHRTFVDDLIKLYPRENVARERGVHDSRTPVLVVGMPRSGTSLVEQIISSHPHARGAGEMGFWSDMIRRNGVAIKGGSFDESIRERLAGAYLRALETRAGQAVRIVDKAPVNSDYLGIIHSVFAKVRIIYVQRDPIDTCLSCYFQNFPLSLNYTFDLTDLAHYAQQHRRLMSHWRSVLPPELFLEVPYSELVTNQGAWTRNILTFLDLEWDDRCLNFQSTKRAVMTASSWQVRQQIYTTSIERWRHYEPYIGPLLALRPGN